LALTWHSHFQRWWLRGSNRRLQVSGMLEEPEKVAAVIDEAAKKSLHNMVSA
jgi:hypothetical protein